MTEIFEHDLKINIDDHYHGEKDPKIWFVGVKIFRSCSNQNLVSLIWSSELASFLFFLSFITKSKLCFHSQKNIVYFSKEIQHQLGQRSLKVLFFNLFHKTKLFYSYIQEKKKFLKKNLVSCSCQN